jgi:hypothetical protein
MNDYTRSPYQPVSPCAQMQYQNMNGDPNSDLQAGTPLAQQAGTPMIQQGPQMQPQQAVPASPYAYRNPAMPQPQPQAQMQAQAQMTTPQLPPHLIPGAIASNPTDISALTALNQPMPVTTQNLQYINAFLRTQVGKKVTVDFLIGTNTLEDKTGTLLAVGANYILLNEIETDDLLVCDFYSIKFVQIYY